MRRFRVMPIHPIHVRMSISTFVLRDYGLSMTHVSETRIQADFMSGTHELIDRLGGSTQAFVSAERRREGRLQAQIAA